MTGRTDIFHAFLVVRIVIRTRIGLFRSTGQEHRARCTVPRDIFAHPAANRAQRHVGRAVVAQRRVNRLAVLAREGSRNALCIDVRALRIDFYGGAGLLGGRRSCERIRQRTRQITCAVCVDIHIICAFGQRNACERLALSGFHAERAAR